MSTDTTTNTEKAVADKDGELTATRTPELGLKDLPHVPAYSGASAYERVDHPSHYGGDTTYEVIKVINAWELNFELGNTVKYIARCGNKPGADELEDLMKAKRYLQYEIDKLSR